MSQEESGATRLRTRLAETLAGPPSADARFIADVIERLDAESLAELEVAILAMMGSYGAEAKELATRVAASTGVPSEDLRHRVHAGRERVERLQQIHRAVGLHQLGKLLEHALLTAAPKAQAALAAVAAEDAPPAEGASTAAEEPIDPERDLHRVMLAFAASDLERRVASGEIDPDRADHYRRVLREIDNTDSRGSPGLGGAVEKLGHLRSIQAEFARFVEDPSAPQAARATAGSRAESLMRHGRRLSAWWHSEAISATGQLSLETGRKLQLPGIGAWRSISGPIDEAEAFRLERERHRPFAVELREFTRRSHLAIARPIWPSPSLPAVHPSEVFLGGGRTSARAVGEACASWHWTLSMASKAREPGQARWEQLARSAVAIFDFCGYQRVVDAGGQPSNETLLQAAMPHCAGAYEMGLALVLGKPIVVLASADDDDLPFDIDIPPIRLRGDRADARLIADGIDEAVYGPQRSGAGSSVEAARTSLRRLAAGGAPEGLAQSLASIPESTWSDALAAARAIEGLLTELPPPRPLLLRPAWPVCESQADPRRVFHVMSFRGSWCDGARRTVESACAAVGARYVRGDMAVEADIIRSVWDELCRASLVVADLTDASCCAALELGIAHALGRPVVIAAQHDPNLYFASLRKRRIHRWQNDDQGLADLRVAVQEALEALR